MAKRISEIILASNFSGPAPFIFNLSSCSCGSMDNERAGVAVKKESAKYLWVQEGRVLCQFTVRVKLPKEASGAKFGF